MKVSIVIVNDNRPRIFTNVTRWSHQSDGSVLLYMIQDKAEYQAIFAAGQWIYLVEHD